MESTVTTRTFQADDTDAIWAILVRSWEAGEWPGMTRHDCESIRDRLPIEPESRIVALEDGQVVGYAIPGFEQLIVHPDYRRRGHGTRLVARALEMMREKGRDRLELAVPPGSADAEAFARANGFSYWSSLWLLGLDPTVDVPPPSFPDQVMTRTFVAGQDEEVFATLFNTSFADHPSPVSVTVEAVRHVHSLPGFDPSGFLLVFSTDDPDTPIAFCRTSVHDGTGDIEFIGVLPEWRGIGLGRELLRWGIHHIRAKGIRQIQLSVEAANERALGLYERTGFHRVQEWPRWARSVS